MPQVKIAVNYDSHTYWPEPVEAGLKAAGLGEVEYNHDRSRSWWSTRKVPRHHPTLIVLLEAHERETADARGREYVVGEGEFIRIHDLPSGRYAILSGYRCEDAVVTPESFAWVQVECGEGP